MDQKITAVIIEDEAIEQQLLQKLLSPYNDIKIVGTAAKVEDATNLIINQKPNLVFLDVQLFGKQAFEIIEQIEEFDITPYIIFTTAHKEYAIEALRHEAVYFLLKPIDKEELECSINRLRNKIAETYNIQNLKKQLASSFKKCIISSFSRTYFVDYKDIIFLETVKGQSCSYIHTSTQEKHIEASKGLGEFEKELLNQGFIRPSRFFIINPLHIKAIHQSGKIELSKGEIKIASRKVKDLITKLQDF
ncbi:MAG: response regulator transcription factor [Bacteroidales bacterium]|nr:response regulator transcription factor [Bacteroidales bacterium]